MGAAAPVPSPSLGQPVELSPTEVAGHKERIADIAENLDLALLVQGGDTPAAPDALVEVDDTPEQATKEISDGLGLENGAKQGLLVEARDLSSTAEEFNQATDNPVTSSSASVQDLQVTETANGDGQIIADVYVRREMLAGNVWEEVQPYILGLDAERQNYTSLVILDTTDLDDAPGTAAVAVRVPSPAEQDVPSPAEDAGTTGQGAAAPSGVATAMNALYMQNGEEAQIKPALGAGDATVMTVGLSSSNKERVARYADIYWDNYNPAYREERNDCTNFVSQAMRYAGWGDDTGWYRSNANWWYNSVNNSFSWSAAENFYQYSIIESKRLTNTYDRYVLVRGDLLMYKQKASAASMSHTMVVTDRINNQPYLTYHSNDRHGVPLSFVISESKAEVWIPART